MICTNIRERIGFSTAWAELALTRQPPPLCPECSKPDPPFWEAQTGPTQWPYALPLLGPALSAPSPSGRIRIIAQPDRPAACPCHTKERGLIDDDEIGRGSHRECRRVRFEHRQLADRLGPPHLEPRKAENDRDRDGAPN